VTIKAKLRIIALLPLFVFVTAGGIEYWSYHVLGSLYPQGDLVGKISQMTFRLVSLTYEYGITHGERAAGQWNNQYAEVEQLLKDLPVVFGRSTDDRQFRQFEDLRRSFTKSEKLFAEILLYDNRPAADGPDRPAPQFRNNMINRLILELQAVIPLTDRMYAEVVAAMQHSIRFRLLLTVTFYLSLSLSLLILTFWLIRGINRSLLKFQGGIEAVADGDLGARVNLATGDELGELARGFDVMTERLAAVTVSRDELVKEIGERRQAEENLAASEGKLKEAQRLAHLGSWELDLTSNALNWSDEIYRIFEIDPNVFGATYEAFLAAIHPDDRDMVNQAYTHSLETQTPYEVEHRLLMPDGRIKFVHERCETHFDGDGKPLRSLGTVQDVTGRRRIEEEFETLNEDLERRIVARTRALEAQTQEVEATQQALMNIVDDLNHKTMELEEANFKLQDLDRLKSMFIAAMSHELRTPLNSIIGFSSIVQEEWLGPLNKEQKEKLAIVLRTGKHLLSLINDLIDVSKIEAGKVETTMDEFDLHDLIVEAAALSEADLTTRGITLEVEPIHQLLHTDRRRLYQCVVNLLGNAVKFTRQGKITLKTELVRDHDAPSGQERVAISIADTGIGIREEDMPKLFCSFVRLTLPEDMQVKGTGLGLYLVKKIVTDVLGGAVSATSVYGQGSEFRLTVPVK
jgi:PAS domain S-box-containing protein